MTYVGNVLRTVKENGLEENALAIFTSDNGPHQEAGGDPDYVNSNGNLKGIKRDLYEGGIPRALHCLSKRRNGIRFNK